ncbi:MAG: hypothetical protein HZB46_12040 [Solirubrobacterales bacterium]|nr:hypothetical protein [Solirubrobacterales bacterium]
MPELLDAPLALKAPGAVWWRARLRDDDGRVWKAEGPSPEELGWSGPGEVAALRSLRPVAIDLRAELAGGGAVARALRRVLLAPGVQVRRWKDAGATLFRPAGEPCATVVVPADATLAAALLASRGALVLAGPPHERLAAVPGATDPLVLDAAPLPPNVPVAEPRDPAAWDALLAELGATARR